MTTGQQTPDPARDSPHLSLQRTANSLGIYVRTYRLYVRATYATRCLLRAPQRARLHGALFAFPEAGGSSTRRGLFFVALPTGKRYSVLAYGTLSGPIVPLRLLAGACEAHIALSSFPCPSPTLCSAALFLPVISARFTHAQQRQASIVFVAISLEK